ncbi:MAG: hypothetical protein NVS4B13_12040 [Candidatus Elarobacter sp.]
MRHVREVVAAGIVAAIGLGVLAVRYAPGRSAREDDGAALGRRRHVDSAAATLPNESQTGAAWTTAPSDVLERLSAADSASAAPYAVEVAAINTLPGALDKLQEFGDSTPATYSPIELAGQARWFKVIVGAAATPAGADSVRAELRRRGAIDGEGGTLVQTPFALLVERSVTREAARALTRGYVARGLPVYALGQPDGTARLYAGAFETPDRSAVLAQSLRNSGLAPTLVYRIGRPL